MMRYVNAVVFPAMILAGCTTCPKQPPRSTPEQQQKKQQQPLLGSVIFLHPDGMSVGHWDATRLRHVGPDGFLAWDRLPHLAIYRATSKGSLRMSSTAGAAIHAYGVKASMEGFGREPGAEITAASGKKLSVMMEAIARGLATGLVQTAALTDPGTAVFVAKAQQRDHHDVIAAQIIEAGVDVILGGGEKYLLPAGLKGRFGPGKRKDGRDLIAEAKKRGYRVVTTREELLALPAATPRVLGVFARGATFNDKYEEQLLAEGLPAYDPAAPTMAEMTAVALKILSAKGRRFLLVGEEEATDNFSNKTNAAGFLAAARRADDAVEVARRFVEKNPATLLLVGSDSNANGLQIGVVPKLAPDGVKLAPTNIAGCPADGQRGTGTEPFLSAPDRHGKRHPFSIIWGSDDDTLANMVLRAAGLNAERVRGTLDNTAVYALTALTLFGEVKSSPVP